MSLPSDGRAWTATELARNAGVAPSTATSHLNLLVGGGVLVEERHGRHRYLRVADRTVIDLIEITDAMVERGPLEWGPEPGLTGEGAVWLAEIGITVPSGSRRPLVRACLDRTERRPHLAGAVGAALCAHTLTAGWITRIGTTRALTVTPAGRRAWHDHLGLPPADL
ncbi:winged helix-turn-helix domain-containing protein [Streptomyces sp. NPDC087532]|uniref:winged helix-turn-helix domain-containing protein n=1 Tax=Streptomyces sp. NPDC087532 TaxID=3365795 RepID=UPI003815638A